MMVETVRIQEEEKDDGIVIILADRSYLYRLFQRIFGDAPTLELLQIISNHYMREAIELYIEDHNEQHSREYLEVLHTLKTIDQQTLDHVKDEYTHLLVGPNKLPAPPWESVYINKERMIFQDSTLKVRQAYLKYGLLPANYPHEADDHLALELDFMLHLSSLLLEKYEQMQVGSMCITGNTDTDEIKKLIDDQQAFLDEHLLVWVGSFAEQIQHGQTQIFYPQMALLLEQLIKADRQVLTEISAAIG